MTKQTKKTAANNALLKACKKLWNHKIYATCLALMNQPETLDSREADVVHFLSNFYRADVWTAGQDSASLKWLRLMSNPLAAWHTCDDAVADGIRNAVSIVLGERLDSDHDAIRLQAASDLGKLFRKVPAHNSDLHLDFLASIGAA